MAEAKETISFHLIKSPDYLTRRADGIVGSVTPSGDLHLSFFIERAAIPQQLEYELEEDGSLGKLIEITGKRGIVREMQCGFIIDAETAKNLHAHLETFIKASIAVESPQ